MASTGASLVLYGVAEALTPIPTVPEETQDPINSFSFGGIQNTSRAGVPVPVVYGKMLTGSIVVSAAIDTNQVEV
jgi:predicted phage tail protein